MVCNYMYRFVKIAYLDNPFLTHITTYHNYSVSKAYIIHDYISL